MKRLSTAILLLCFNVLDAGAATDRTTAIVSDLHFGVGRDETGRWYAIEDARWSDDWQGFLESLDRHGQGKTDLVFNGDTFELWQTIGEACSHDRSRNLGCNEDEAVKRIERVIAQHKPELEALRRFADHDENRVVIVPGNHDAALFYPRVAKAVVAGIASKPGRVAIAEAGYWLSSDSRIYAEHGQQIGSEVNKFDRWPSPIVEENGTKYIQRSWGEQFVQEYYNQHEITYPIIDNIGDEATGIRYGMAAANTSATAGAVASFVKFFLLDVSWRQFIRSLGAPGEWDVAALRASGDSFLLESFATDDPVRTGVEKALKDKNLALTIDSLADDEIRQICDQRAALRTYQEQHLLPLTISRCTSKLGALGQRVAGTEAKHFREHVVATANALQQSGKSRRPFDVFVYSHTHLADAGFFPLNGNWKPVALNTGAWQRVISREQLEDEMRKRQLTPRDVLTTLTLDDLPPCYSVVLVDPYSDAPNPLLHWWKVDASRRGSLVRTCP